MVEQGVLRLAGRATPHLLAARMVSHFMKMVFCILRLVLLSCSFGASACRPDLQLLVMVRDNQAPVVVAE